MSVTVCTMYSPSHQPLADISIPNLQWYSDKHGYNMKIIEVENDKWEYKKHEAFMAMFKHLEYGSVVWYKDIDSLITNMTIPITNYIDNDHSFYLTRDFTELNGGSVIIKNTGRGRSVNDFILSKKEQYQNEQNVYNACFERIKPHTKILPHPSINSYQYELYPECKNYVGKEYLGDWKIGNLLFHVPALSMDKRIQALKNIKQHIIYE